MIIDEGDFVLFKDPAKFAKEGKKRPTICFTASPPLEGQDPLEEEIYKSLGFTHYAYWPKALPLRDAFKAPQSISVKDGNQIIEFIKARAV